MIFFKQEPFIWCPVIIFLRSGDYSCKLGNRNTHFGIFLQLKCCLTFDKLFHPTVSLGPPLFERWGKVVAYLWEVYGAGEWAQVY